MLLTRNNIDLLLELVKTSFKMRYQNSILGFLWVLIKPYAMFLVMYVIFSNIIRSTVDHYALYLLTGVIFISFINELLVLGQMALLERSNIILKVNFPRQIAIFSALIGAVINLFINLALIFVLTTFAGITLYFVNVLYLLFVIITILIWALGIAFLTSIITVQIRDLKNIIELGMFVMQYATPIFYSLQDPFISNETVKKIIELNPLTILMNQFRAGINIYGEIDVILMFITAVIGVIFTYGTYLFFNTKIRKVAEYF